MPIFERSWQNRLVRGRNILPRIRDQRKDSTCSYHCVAGAVESAKKKAFAEINQDFENEVSVDYLILKLGDPPSIKEILSLIKTERVLIVDVFQHCLRQGFDSIANHENLERVKIEDFISLRPQENGDDFAHLMTHVLSGGTAIGVFRATSSYNDTMIYYQDLGEPIIYDSIDEDWYEGFKGDDDHEPYEVEMEDEEVYRTVLIISLGMDEYDNLFWRVLDSHGPNVGEGATRKIAVNLIKEAHILVASA